MADTKISGLSELTAVAPDDWLVAVDVSGTAATMKATVENVQTDWHVGARVYNSANISIPNATSTALTYDTERFDTDAIHSTVANTSRLTCKTAGKYLIWFVGYFVNDANGSIRLGYIQLNGATTLAQERKAPNAINSATFCVSCVYDLAVNDYVEFFAWQDAGGAINFLAAANQSPEFGIQRIG